jgi:hypothetical protein
VLRRAHFEAHPAPFCIVGLPASPTPSGGDRTGLAGKAYICRM